MAVSTVDGLERTRDADLADFRADLREAYERGRRDERASRRRHPVFMTLLFLVAAIGAALLVLAAANGSFGRAGLVIDQSLGSALGNMSSSTS